MPDRFTKGGFCQPYSCLQALHERKVIFQRVKVSPHHCGYFCKWSGGRGEMDTVILNFGRVVQVVLPFGKILLAKDVKVKPEGTHGSVV